MRGNAPFRIAASKSKLPRTVKDHLKGQLLGIVEAITPDGMELQTLFAWDSKSGDWAEPPSKPRVLWQTPTEPVVNGVLYTFVLEPDYLSSADQESENALLPRIRTDDDEGPVVVVEALLERPVEKERRKTKQPSVQFVGQSRVLQNAERVLEDSFLDVEAIRRRYFQDGVELHFMPQPQVYLAVRDRLAIGPVELIRGGDGRWRAGDARELPILQSLTTSFYQGLDVNGVRRYLLKTHPTPPQRVAMADFRLDEQIVQDCLSGLDKHDAALLTGEALVRSLRDTSLTADATEEENLLALYRQFRVEGAIQRLLESSALHTEIREKLLTLPAVQRFLEQEAEESRHIAKLHIESELAERRAIADREHATVLVEAKVAQGTRDAALEEMGHVRAEIERLRRDLSAETEVRIADIAASVTERVMSASSRLLSSRPNLDDTSVPTSSPIQNVPLPSVPLRYPLSVHASIADIEDGPDALRKLRKRLNASGIHEQAASQFLGALITQMVPIIVGPAALPFLEAAADVLFGGKILRRTVSSLMVEFSELFGTIHPISGRYRPDPDLLADLLLTATDDAGHHLIVFDGFNRAEPEAMFMPLLASQSWRDSQRLPILHPNGLQPEDPYARLAEAIWPERFIAAYRFAPRAVRVPACMRLNSATVLCEFTERKSGKIGRRTAASASAWSAMRDAALAHEEEASIIVRGAAIPDKIRQSAQSVGAGIAAQSLFCAALLSCGVSPSEAADLTRDSLLVSSLIMTGQEVPDVDAAEIRRYQVALEGF